MVFTNGTVAVALWFAGEDSVIEVEVEPREFERKQN